MGFSVFNISFNANLRREGNLNPPGGKDVAPFYESINMHPTIFGNRVSEWHLVYPAGFLERVCGCCLSSLEEYLKTNKRDPYLSFKDGWYLVEHFNNDARFPVVNPFYKT